MWRQLHYILTPIPICPWYHAHTLQHAPTALTLHDIVTSMGDVTAAAADSGDLGRGIWSEAMPAADGELHAH